MNGNIAEYRKKLDSMKIKREMLLETQNVHKKKIAEFSRKHENSKKARIIIQKVAQEVQSNIEERFSNIGSLALSTVFDNPYEFVARFEIRRGKIECDLLFRKNGVEMIPLDSSSYGACNIASFACHCAMWSMAKNRACMILDEPFPHLSAEYQPAASEMLKMLSRELDLQIIMVSHNEYIIKEADNLIELER